MVRLLAGSVEPLFDAPMMAGESTVERVIPVHLLPQAVALETQLDALRDQIVDLVAVRARLEARMKARLEGEDWNGLDETIKEFHGLGSKDALAERLKTLKEQSARQQAERKVPILTRTAIARLEELQALIDRYLDDDEVNAFTDALARGRADAEEKAKTPSKTRVRKGKTAAPGTEAPAKPAVPLLPKAAAQQSPAATGTGAEARSN
jgi:hypothetical protein